MGTCVCVEMERKKPMTQIARLGFGKWGAAVHVQGWKLALVPGLGGGEGDVQGPVKAGETPWTGRGRLGWDLVPRETVGFLRTLGTPRGGSRTGSGLQSLGSSVG